MSVSNSFFPPPLPHRLVRNFPSSAFYFSESPFVCSHSELYPFWNTTTAIRQHGSHSPCRAPTSQPASWLRFPHTSHPTAQRELAQQASGRPHCQTPSHMTSGSVSVWPASAHPARQRTIWSTASVGLANIWQLTIHSTIRSNNKSLASRQPHSLTRNQRFNINLISFWTHTVHPINSRSGQSLATTTFFIFFFYRCHNSSLVFAHSVIRFHYFLILSWFFQC